MYTVETLEKYPFLEGKKYIGYILSLTPSQIKKFGEKDFITLDFDKPEPFVVFLTNSQTEKIEDAKNLEKKIDLKFTKNQVKKTFPFIKKFNRERLIKSLKEQLSNIKEKNAKKEERLEKYKAKLKIEKNKRDVSGSH